MNYLRKALHGNHGWLAGVIALLLGCSSISGCDVARTTYQHIQCEKALKEMLKDPESYRKMSDFRVTQSVAEQPTVYGWDFNAKNSMGGYTGSNEALCYSNPSGVTQVHIVDPDSPGFTEDFLANTNPDLARRRQAYKDQINASYQAEMNRLDQWADEQQQWADEQLRQLRGE